MKSIGFSKKSRVLNLNAFTTNWYLKQLYENNYPVTYFLFFISSAFTQIINVPDFAQPDVKAFYTEYSNNLIKIIKAIREKNETKLLLY